MPWEEEEEEGKKEEEEEREEEEGSRVRTHICLGSCWELSTPWPSGLLISDEHVHQGPPQ